MYLSCCCSKSHEHSDDEDCDYEVADKKERPCWCKAIKWTSIVLISLAILAFILVFIVLPLVCMWSVEFQRFMMFPNFDQPENPQYTNYAKYDTSGVRNLYVSVDDLYNKDRKVSLGVWQVLPRDEIAAPEMQDDEYFDKALYESTKPIVIYFHGNSGTRIYPLPTYEVLREFFHVIAFDYRGYGDSTDALRTENGVVNDALQFYQWVQKKTKQPQIYVWGHSLGTALSTHTLKRLKDEKDLVPMGLFLEAPFTTMDEEVTYHPIGKYFAWLPWFAGTVQKPLINNGFLFRTTTNILSIDCPIMIMHAKDDGMIPHKLGKKLFEVARDKRDMETQGEARFHDFAGNYGYGHTGINRAPELPGYIRSFMEYCTEYKSSTTKKKKN